MRTSIWTLVAIACLSGGCAVTTAGLYATDNRPFTSGIERVEPLGTVERRVSVSSIDFDPVRIACVGEERAARERVEDVHYGIDMGGRLFYGFVALGESAMSAGVLGATLAEEPYDYGWVVAAAIVGLDALATWIMTFALPDFREDRSHEREGSWRTRSGCPAGVVTLEVEGRSLAVDAGGSLSAEDEAWLLEALLREAAPVLVAGEQRIDLAAQVPLCALAARHGHLKPRCPPASIAVPPPPPIRLELELSVP